MEFKSGSRKYCLRGPNVFLGKWLYLNSDWGQQDIHFLATGWVQLCAGQCLTTSMEERGIGLMCTVCQFLWNNTLNMSNFLKKGGGSFIEIGLYTIWFTHLRVHSTHRYIAAMTVVSFRTFSPPQKESCTLFYHPPFPPLHSCCKQPPICLLCL